MCIELKILALAFGMYGPDMKFLRVEPSIDNAIRGPNNLSPIGYPMIPNATTESPALSGRY